MTEGRDGEGSSYQAVRTQALRTNAQEDGLVDGCEA